METKLETVARGLKLRPKRGKRVPFGQFLRESAENPQSYDTPFERLVSHVKALGKQAPKTPYLKMLQLLGIPSYKAFADIKGNEQTIHHIFSNPLREQMLVLLGPAGSGKTKITQRFAELLT